MMGWVMLAGVALVAAVLLWLTGFPRRMWTIAATALMLGAAGYAWQGSPGLAGHPIAAEEKHGQVDQQLVDLRDAMFGKYGTWAWTYGNMADGMTRAGKLRTAVEVWEGGVRNKPDDPALWTGLGFALFQHDRQISPASRFAFEKAIAVYPTHPGPYFFYGLAQASTGKLQEARANWVKAIERTPENASYRNILLMQAIQLELLIRQQAGQGAPPRAK